MSRAQRGVSLHSTERIHTTAVPDAERKLVDGVLHSYYTIRTVTSSRTFTVEKRFSEILAAHDQLFALFPHRFVTATSGTDASDTDSSDVHHSQSSAIVDVDLRALNLCRKKRTSRTMEARRMALETYLRQVLADSSMAALLLSVLSSTPGHHRAITAAVETLGYSAATPSLSLSSESASVVDSPSLSRAIGEETPVVPAEPPPPPHLVYLAQAAREDKYGTAISPETGSECPFAPGTRVSFSLEDMDAFDCLLEHGYALVPLRPDEEPDVSVPQLPADAPLPSDDECLGAPPQPGQRVVVSLATLAWDGASSAAVRLDALPVAVFTLGDLRGTCGQGSGIPHGLHEVLRLMNPGSSATVVLSPALAFKDDGVPPLLPPGAHMVLQLTLHAVSGSPRDMGPFVSLADAGGASQPASGRAEALGDASVDRFGTGGALRILGDDRPVLDEELAAWEAGAGVGGRGAGAAPAAAVPLQQLAQPSRRQRVVLIGPRDSDLDQGAGTGLRHRPPIAPAPSSAPASYALATAPPLPKAPSLQPPHEGGGARPMSMADYLQRQAALAPGGGATTPTATSIPTAAGSEHPTGYVRPSQGYGRTATAPPGTMESHLQRSATIGAGSAGPGIDGTASFGSSGGVVRNPDGSMVLPGGRVMPSPEEAERAFRAYLAQTGQPAPPPLLSPGDRGGGQKKTSSGGGILRALSLKGSSSGGSASRATGKGAQASALRSSDGVGEIVTGADGAHWAGGVAAAPVVSSGKGIFRGLLGGGRSKSVFSS